MKISVCMASYNGEKFIKRQIESILCQLGESDELIIVDDYSMDSTVLKIREFADSRLRLYVNNENMGFIKAFERAISLSKGEVIFLSDQDDVWLEEKVSEVCQHMREENIDLLFHDALVVDERYNIIFKSFSDMRKITVNPFLNIISNSFTGCCMAFRASLKDYILPIPKKAIYHDRWIAIIAGLNGFRLQFMDKQLIYYVRHGKNVSSLRRRKWKEVIKDRISLLTCLAEYYRRTLIYKIRDMYGD